MAGCIANIIKTVLDKILSKDHTGFIKGRYIGENTRLIYDIMQYTETYTWSFSISGLQKVI